MVHCNRCQRTIHRRNNSHFYSTVSSSNVSLASSSSQDTNIDVADYNLEVGGSPNSSAQGSDQEAEEDYAGLLSLDTQAD